MTRYAHGMNMGMIHNPAIQKCTTLHYPPLPRTTLQYLVIPYTTINSPWSSVIIESIDSSSNYSGGCSSALLLHCNEGSSCIAICSERRETCIATCSQAPPDPAQAPPKKAQRKSKKAPPDPALGPSGPVERKRKKKTVYGA